MATHDIAITSNNTHEQFFIPQILPNRQNRYKTFSLNSYIYYTYPKDFVENRNISNILEEAPLCSINGNLAFRQNYELRMISSARLRLAIVYQLA